MKLHAALQSTTNTIFTLAILLSGKLEKNNHDLSKIFKNYASLKNDNVQSLLDFVDTLEVNITALTDMRIPDLTDYVLI